MSARCALIELFPVVRACALLAALPGDVSRRHSQHRLNIIVVYLVFARRLLIIITSEKHHDSDRHRGQHWTETREACVKRLTLSSVGSACIGEHNRDSA
jgi:hypothetical protein